MESGPAKFVGALKVALSRMQNKSHDIPHCPKAQQIGTRGPEPDYGTACEPMMVRGAITLLGQLIEANHVGLEWGTGSSTQWLLHRLGHLYSIEQDEPWLAQLEATVMLNMPHRATRWTRVHAGCEELKPGGCKHVTGRLDNSNTDQRDANSYRRYEETPRSVFVPGLRSGTNFSGFDFIAVDGASRPRCLQEACGTLERPGLINPAHGILVLDNADREAYFAGVSPQFRTRGSVSRSPIEATRQLYGWHATGTMSIALRRGASFRSSRAQLRAMRAMSGAASTE
jgi:hypothetical protein